MQDDVKATIMVASMRGLIAFAESVIKDITTKDKGKVIDVNTKIRRITKKK